MAYSSAALVAALLFPLLATPQAAHAYNAFSHEQITRDALMYLRANPHVFTETGDWIETFGQPGGLLEELLVRSTVDADFRTDVWLGAWFHHPFTGAQSGSSFAMFTRMLHFIDVTDKGRYWAYDGYNYKDSSRQGADGYLSLPTVTTQGALSHALSGQNTAFPEHGIDLGAYGMGFEADARAWHHLYYDEDSDDSTFPPAYVPAQMAFNALVSSARAPKDDSQSWTDNLPLATGVFSTGYLSRHYWRGDVAGLPEGLDLLGLAFHLSQDVTVPHHALGTADYCHQELEDLADSMACNTTAHIDITPYNEGNFGARTADQCVYMYDESIVRRLVGSTPALDAASSLTVSERLVATALDSAHWDWGSPDDDDDHLYTRLPDGQLFRGTSCAQFMWRPDIRAELRLQYNKAVAATIVVFELAARAYELRHRPPLQSLAQQLFGLVAPN